MIKSMDCNWRFILFLAFVAMGSLLSCGEIDEEPAEIQVRLHIPPQQDLGRIQLAEGDIFLTDFVFEGRREGASPVRIERNQLIEASALPTGGYFELIHFFLPPGVYQQISLAVSFTPQNGQPSVAVRGTFLSPPNNQVPLVIEYDAQERFDLTASNRIQAGEALILRRGEQSYLDIELNPRLWLEGIPQGWWVAAERVPDGTVGAIKVNDRLNDRIFESIAERIRSSVRLVHE